MDRFVIYGIIEPETKKMVYIDFCIDKDDDSYMDKTEKDFLNLAIETMECTNNPYKYDLINMYNENISYYNKGIYIVVLDILDNDDEVCEITDAYKKLFKPRYCAYDLINIYNDYEFVLNKNGRNE